MGRNLKQHMKLKELGLKHIYQAAALLLFLAVGSSMLATAPMAKYVTKAQITDSATVAEFSVSAAEITTDKAFTLNSDDTTADYSFTVTSNSEVATSYDVIVTLPEKIDGVTLSLKNTTQSTTVAGTASADGTTYTFAGAGSFNPASSQTDALTLTFTLADETAATAATHTGIGVQAVVTQVQR